KNRVAFTYTSTKRDTFNADVQTFEALGRNERFEYQGVLDLSDMVKAVFGAETQKSKYRSGSGVGADRFIANIDSVYGQVSITPRAGLPATAGMRADAHTKVAGERTCAWDVC